MRTIDERHFAAPPDAVFAVVCDVLQWPVLLTHYRAVRLLGETREGRVVEMAARLGCIPLRWCASMRVDAATRTVHYRHVAGPSTGMTVRWEISAEDAGTRVRLVHELTLTHPLLRNPLGQWLVGWGVVSPVACRTLAGLQAQVEGATRCDAP